VESGRCSPWNWIVAATNKAMEAIDEKIKQEMKAATEGMIPSIPGMDLGNLFG